MTSIQEGEHDEDIPSIDTPAAPTAEQIQGPITRARVKQLNYQVLLFLETLYYIHELGMKTEQKWTELSVAIFVFIFLCGSRNEYGNTGNKYENRYFRKQIWNEYGADADEKQMIVGTKRPPESYRKTQKSQENRKTCALNLSQLLGVMGE
jgi:hypothetical protein